LRLADLGFRTELPSDAIPDIIGLAHKPIKLGDIALRMAGTNADKRAAVVALCDRLCRTPFRLLATVS
jgi:hypothetical protein